MSTLFGKIVLYRFPYRFWLKNVKEPCIFPFELQLGLIEGVTPALASLIGQCHAARTQGQVLEWLENDHGVAMGATRLRKLVAALDECLTEQSQAAQVAALLKAMETANQSSGSRKPVLAVGRDGITLCEYRYRFWEVATAATVTVFDRAGKRLTTVYLAHPPELGQATMSKMLTDLLTEVLRQWRGPLPTLAFIADSGGNESSYYEDVLRKMKHPLTDARLKWVRVVDFFHAAERVWSMSEALFGKKSKKYYRWARRMLRLLKNKSNGPKRVLQSAAAHLAALQTRQESPRATTKGSQLHSQADQVDAVLRVEEMPYPDRQRHHGGRLQDGVHPAAQTVRNAMDACRRPTHPDAANAAVE